jgi:hypothetical protein
VQEAEGEQESGGRYADEAAHALLGLCSCYHERPVLNQYRPPALAPAANHPMLTDLATTPCLAAEVALDRIPELLGEIERLRAVAWCGYAAGGAVR